MAAVLADLGVVCALGNNKESVAKALFDPSLANNSTLLTKRDDILHNGESLYIGQVTSPLPSLVNFESHFQTHNNQLAYAAWLQIADTFNQLSTSYSADRIAVVTGTSTSGINEGEQAVSHYQQHNSWPETFAYSMQEMYAPADFIAHISGAKGPIYSISTACTSSAKAIASAKLILDQNLADIVICGGVDSISHLPCNGFRALESTSAGICAPFSTDRDGINLGEAAALFIMHKAQHGIAVVSVGESSDAYHISSPHPEGEGAYTAMATALQNGNLAPEQIDYLNLHGTGTPKNDEMEATAVNKLFNNALACSSTKHLTGHTLGAAGALEAGLCWLILSPYNAGANAPVNAHRLARDTDLAKINLWQGDSLAKRQYCMSNSFAFGGNNISLILEACDE